MIDMEKRDFSPVKLEASGGVSPEVVAAKQRFGIIGNAPALVEAVARAVRVAPIDLSVLVTGESGAGKEFFPQIIHAYSARKHSKYIAVNCGAIPEGTIDSELFGHEKGSFTGAVASRKGYFEEADGGTIFLDEVAELPLTTQARLLRVLETGEFLKVGSSTVQKTNIRVVAATNVDLPRAIANGTFREDLYYRLSTIQIVVPPLRDRGNDIVMLARKFAADFAERYRTPAITFSDDARAALLHYRWPGNVRQLKNVVEQTALFEAGNTVTGGVLAQYLPAVTTTYMPATQNADAASATSYAREREMLFNMIFSLRSKIDDLTARLDSVSTPLTATTDVGADSAAFGVPHSSVPALTDYGTITPTPPPAAAPESAERQRILSALSRHNGLRRAAAEDLGISERTLYRKLRDLGLDN